MHVHGSIDAIEILCSQLTMIIREGIHKEAAAIVYFIMIVIQHYNIVRID